MPGERSPGVARARLQVVAPRSRGAVVANRLVVVWWGVLVVAVLFAAVVLNATLASRQGHLDDLRRSVRSADLEHRRLRAEVAVLEAPDRIAAAALRLGLERPTELRFLTPASLPVSAAPPAAAADAGPVTGGSEATGGTGAVG